jgi:type IV pilus assembly protein PilY1
MVDLVKLATDNELWSLDNTGTPVQGLAVYATLESNSFVTDPISVDYNLDYKTDVIYYGTINGDSGNGWGGQLRRIVIDNDEDTTNWDASKTLINVNQPISAAPTVGLDNEGRNWVFFGTGRFYVNADKIDKSLQSFYGIKEPVVDPTVLNKIKTWDTVDRISLFDVTNIQVFTDTNHTVTGLGSGNTWNDLLLEQKAYDGWYLDFYAEDGVTLEGERNIGQAALIGGLLSFTTFTPSDDICVASGESDLWALYYKTGTAFYNNILGTSLQTVNGVPLEKSLRKISLGQGLATSPSIHTGREKGSVVFVQSSTGEIKRIEEENPLSTKSGRLSWRLR